VDTTRVTSKLEEVRFFLDHLSDVDGVWFQRTPEAFVFYWSAFLNAGYSVTELLGHAMAPTLRQRRFRGKTGKRVFQEWLDEWRERRLQPEERPVWDFMCVQRGAEVHREGATTVPETYVIPVAPPPARLSPNFALLTGFAGPPELLGATVLREAIRHNFPIGEERLEGLKACRCYVALLERLIDDAKAEAAAIRA